MDIETTERQGQDDSRHLQRLMSSWEFLADLGFADLLLLVPVYGATSSQINKFVVVAQLRPATAQTLYSETQIGQAFDYEERPYLFDTWQSGKITEGSVMLAQAASVRAIPVRNDGRMVAVLSRESSASTGRRAGQLEQTYYQIFDRFCLMISSGAFPFETEEPEPEESPRVGDGAMLLDADQRIKYLSPNAINAMHRMGVDFNIAGKTLGSAGLDETPIKTAYSSLAPVTLDVGQEHNVIVTMRCLPLLEEGKTTGALVLMRDVTDLRKRDRLLISKDATIREIHHRVKNNLQTVTSLLRLQARRLGREERLALEEAERRIESIAMVDEILSRDPSQAAPFDEVLKSLVRLAEETAESLERVVSIRVSGEVGDLDAAIATPLALILTELLVNAVEHAFLPEEFVRGAATSEGGNFVEVSFDKGVSDLNVKVRDNGRGFPGDFAMDNSENLGLSITHDLVVSQLQGTMQISNDEGAIVELKIPI